MSYTAHSFADDVVATLQEQGYSVHAHDGEGKDIDLQSGQAFWFTWAHPSGLADCETGPTHDTELGAWHSALHHHLVVSEINLDLCLGPDPTAIRIDLPFPDQACYDLMCTAAEGGINYWADIIKRKRQKRKRQKRDDSEIPDIVRFEAQVQDGPVACDHPEIEAAEIDRFEIGPAEIRTGIRRLLAPGAKISNAIRNDCVMTLTDNEHAPDADTADAIVQFAVFGELVFG